MGPTNWLGVEFWVQSIILQYITLSDSSVKEGGGLIFQNSNMVPLIFQDFIYTLHIRLPNYFLKFSLVFQNLIYFFTYRPFKKNFLGPPLSVCIYILVLV